MHRTVRICIMIFFAVDYIICLAYIVAKSGTYTLRKYLLNYGFSCVDPEIESTKDQRINTLYIFTFY